MLVESLSRLKHRLKSTVGRRYLAALLLIVASVFITVALHAHAGMAAFAFTSIPAVLTGAMLGVRAGVIAAIICSANALILQIGLGYSLATAAMQTGTAAPITLLMAYGAGYVYRFAISSKRDERERRQAEERANRLSAQLDQAQKMEALGTLAGGVAHDINNVLAVIMSAASVIEKDLKPDDPDAESIKDILAACRRGRSLIRNLLGFAYRSKLVSEAFDIAEIVEDSARLLERTLNKKITVEQRIERGTYLFQADRGQFEQAIMNLCINGIAAMNDSGRLILSLKKVALTESSLERLPRLEPNILKPGTYFQLSVIDSGTGMDAETRAHIFEPFFTTKPRGEGTGLGLSLVYGTVKSLGGAIEVDSQPGRGTKISLLLPEPQPAQIETSVVQHRPLRTMRGKVLLVDDEPLIRKTGARLLKKLGYEVVVGENGRAAVEIYRQEGHQIALVILDLIMPVMDGTETFIKIKEINPKAKILISSGYEQTKMVETILSKGAVGFIQKPFDIDELQQKLADTAGTELIESNCSPG